MSAKTTFAVALAACLLLSACGEKTPKGQGIVTVGGKTITLADLSAEKGGAALNATPADDDRAALQQLIDRTLLAEAADGKDLKSDPKAAAVQERLLQLAKANAVRAQISAMTPEPSASEVQAFIAKHPESFQDRKFFVLDQIHLRKPAKMPSLAEAFTAKSLDAVQQVIQAAGLPFVRDVTVVDTTTLSDSVVKQLLALPPGQPYEVDQGGGLIEGQVMSVRALPFTGPGAAETAAGLIKRERAAAAVKQRLDALRKDAKIEYINQAYAPAAN